MTKRWIAAALLALILCALAGCAGDKAVQVEATSVPTAVPEAMVTPTPTPVPAEYLFDIIVHPPTCMASGYSVYISKESGGINIRDEVSRLPHEWIEVDGKTVCRNCGTERDEQN